MMPREPLQEQAWWPDVWSGGQVCAFSGLDGPTRWATAVGGRTLPTEVGLQFDTDPVLGLTVRAAIDGQALEPLLGSVPPAVLHGCRMGSASFCVELEAGPHGRVEITLAFTAHDLLRGRVVFRNPDAVTHRAQVQVELASPRLSSIAADQVTAESLRLGLAFNPSALVAAVTPAQARELLTDGQRWDLLPHEYQGEPADQVGLYHIALEAPAEGTAELQFAVQFGASGSVGSPDLLSNGELARLGELAAPAGEPGDGLSPLLRRVRAKALAILRANVFAAEGNLPRRWMVPQRLRHRNFNTFHAPFLAAGALQLEPHLAADVLYCALAQQQPSGHIPEQAWPLGQTLETPPPLLCWGYWRVYEATGDRALLEEAVARLKDYAKYPLAARMLERLGHARSCGAKFLSWGRGEGSNMDNSPRFDINEPFAAVDLTCYAAAEVERVARIIEEVSPEHREAVHLGWMGEELGRETSEFFWDDERGFFFDRYPDGDRVDARTLAGLIPLFTGVATAEQAYRLVTEHLLDPDAFWTPFPLASLAADDPRYCQNMWRGGAWPGMNLLIYEGLQRYGFDEAAAELRERTIAAIADCYQATGSLWEYYDSSGREAPAALPRGRRVGALPDYGWTAAAFLVLLDEAARA